MPKFEFLEDALEFQQSIYLVARALHPSCHHSFGVGDVLNKGMVDARSLGVGGQGNGWHYACWHVDEQTVPGSFEALKRSGTRDIS